MRRTTHTQRRRLAPIALVSAGAVALCLVGLTAPANAAASSAAEAEGRVLDGAGTVDLNTIAGLNPAFTASGTAAKQNAPLDLSLLGTSASDAGITVPNVQLLSGLDSSTPGIFQVGALGQYAETRPTGYAYAASGAVSNDGTIIVGGASADPSYDTKIDLTSVLSQLGLSTQGVIDELGIDLGAISASATSNSGTLSSDYQIAGAKLVIDSPAVTQVDTTLKQTLSGVTGTLNQVLGSAGTVSDLTGALGDVTDQVSNVLGGLAGVDLDVSATVDTKDLSDVLSQVGVIESTGADGTPAGTVSIDLNNGTITVDLAKLLGDPNGDGTLNGLPANTDLLTGSTVQNALNGAINDALTAVVAKVQSAADDEINGIKVNVHVGGDVSLLAGLVDVAKIDITATGTVGQLLDPNGAPFAVTDKSSLLSGTVPIDAVTGPIVSTLLDNVVPAVGTALQGELTDLTSQIGDLGTQLGSQLGDADTGLLGVVNQVVDLKANVQEKPGEFTTTQPHGTAQFTERALQVNLLGVGTGGSTATVNLASASVRGTAVTATLAVSPATAAPGDQVTTTGTGWDPTSTVTLKFTDASGKVVTATVTPAADGSITYTGTAPSATGKVNVVATQGTRTASASYTVAAQSGTATTGTATSGTSAAGKAITLSVTGSKPGYTPQTVTVSRAITAGITAPTPTITGNKQVGGTVVVNPGTPSVAGATPTYSWTVCGTTTVLGTEQTLVVPNTASGKDLCVAVTWSKPGYAPTTMSGKAPIAANTATKTVRLEGPDRFGTAIAISKDTFPVAGSADVVFIARSDLFPDALSAAPVAAKLNGPLLLTPVNSLNAATAAEIKRLGPSKIVIVGGTGAVSTSVENALKKIVPNVVREGGKDRYATSLLISKYGFGSTNVPAAFVATGVDFPDALSAAAYAGSHDMPVLLVNGKAASAPATLTSFLKGAHTTTLSIAGGTGAVTQGIQNSLQSATGHAAKRFGGSDRYATSQLINAQFATAPTAYLATGSTFPDALTGAAAAARIAAPLYVIPKACVPQPVKSKFSSWHTGLVKILGGYGALAKPSVDQLAACK